MSQLSHYAAEIMAQHNNGNFKQHCRTLAGTTPENRAIAALALAVFGEAPVDDRGNDIDSESNLITHARRELQLAGLFDDDSDYDGMLGEAVMQLVRVFSSQGHSGFSAHTTIDLFRRVASYEPLTAIGKSDEEWMFISEDISGEAGGLWQNTRRSTTFSRDGGKTWYDIDDDSLNNGDVHERWVTVQLGDIKIGETQVRVKRKAYEGRFDVHNGKGGLVVGVRNGLVTVHYDDDDPGLMGTQHEPDKLERYVDKV